MSKRIFCLISFLAIACVTCFGQTSFQGLTPGKSTRADVERVLGRPVKKVSETLVEYAPRQLKLTHAKVTFNSVKIYVQYRGNSAAAVVERIELILCPRAKNEHEVGQCKFSEMLSEYDRGAELSGNSLDSVKLNDGKQKWWFGFPRYMLATSISTDSGGESYFEIRWAFYSKELYEAEAPQGNCTGVLRGEWDTNWGRMTIARVDEFGRVRGTYASNNGSFTGADSYGNISGEWKDSTGGGTMYLYFVFGFKDFTGKWTRTSGTGPKEGVLEGRCAGAAGGTN